MALCPSSQSPQPRRCPHVIHGSNSISKGCCTSAAWSPSVHPQILGSEEGAAVDLQKHHGTRQPVTPAAEASADEFSATSFTHCIEDSLSFDNDNLPETFPTLFVEVSNSVERVGAADGEGEENNAPSSNTSEKVENFKSISGRLDALRIQQQLQGMNHPDVIFSMNRLASSNGRREDFLLGKSSNESASRRRGASIRGCGHSRRAACQKLSHEWY